MAFEYDIFISIAPSSNQNSWEKNLSEFLSTLLKRLLGRSLNICISSDFESEEKKEEVITKTEVFVVIITDEYLIDFASKNELQIIEKCINESYNRVFKVYKAEVSAEKQPLFLTNLISYDFFEKSVDQDDDQVYYESKIFEIERHYWTKLTDLAFDIFKIVSDKKESFENQAVFIAETTPDQSKNRESVARELKRLGYSVYPDKILSKNPEILRNEIHDYLSKSFLSIHLIGNTYGEYLENSDTSVVDFQNSVSSEYYEKLQSLAVDSALKNFSRLIWLDPELKLSNEKQKHFIEKLKRDSDLLKGASLIQTPLEHFKSIVISEIKNKINESFHSFNKLNQGVKVYLVHESSSFEKISSISEHLVSHGFEILHSPLLSEERNLLKKHRQNLIDCDAVLIFFDSDDVFWLNSKINDLKKAPGYGRNRPFAAKAILLDCEVDLPTDSYVKNDFIVIKNLTDCSLYSLDKFLDKIQMTYV